MQYTTHNDSCTIHTPYKSQNSAVHHTPYTVFHTNPTPCVIRHSLSHANHASAACRSDCTNFQDLGATNFQDFSGAPSTVPPGGSSCSSSAMGAMGVMGATLTPSLAGRPCRRDYSDLASILMDSAPREVRNTLMIYVSPCS